jgi:hypothetical protein
LDLLCSSKKVGGRFKKMMGLGFISFENAFMTHTYIPFACYHAAMRDDLKQD